jgi:GT2 family glycosyltransferase
MEDVDVGKSLCSAGYKVFYYPMATVVHARQHASISLTPEALKKPHLRWHLGSLWK